MSRVRNKQTMGERELDSCAECLPKSPHGVLRNREEMLQETSGKDPGLHRHSNHKEITQQKHWLYLVALLNFFLLSRNS